MRDFHGSVGSLWKALEMSQLELGKTFSAAAHSGSKK
jgi:hypothetical protein